MAKIRDYATPHGLGPVADIAVAVIYRPARQNLLLGDVGHLGHGRSFGKRRIRRKLRISANLEREQAPAAADAGLCSGRPACEGKCTSPADTHGHVLVPTRAVRHRTCDHTRPGGALPELFSIRCPVRHETTVGRALKDQVPGRCERAPVPRRDMRHAPDLALFDGIPGNQ